MRKLIIVCAVAVLSMIASPSEGKRAAMNTTPKTPSLAVKSQCGLASWYGAQFQGCPTASGPPFDMNAMTCAHRKLPLGTRIRVTDLMNLRSAVLKVNDRGPYVRNRILDVSRAAAKRLGFLGAGLAPVRIEVVSYPGQCTRIRRGPAIAAKGPGGGEDLRLSGPRFAAWAK